MGPGNSRYQATSGEEGFRPPQDLRIQLKILLIRWEAVFIRWTVLNHLSLCGQIAYTARPLHCSDYHRPLILSDDRSLAEIRKVRRSSN